jgi:hypothetical protein
LAYVADTFACRVAVTRNGQITYSRFQDEKGHGSDFHIKERLVGPAMNINVQARDRQSAKVSYYNGPDASKWYTELATFDRVSLGRIQPGIRMELRAHGDNVEKLFYLSPGADPAGIRLAVEGARDLRVNADGELELTAAHPKGTMRFTKPVAYQQINGQRRTVLALFGSIQRMGTF